MGVSNNRILSPSCGHQCGRPHAPSEALEEHPSCLVQLRRCLQSVVSPSCQHHPNLCLPRHRLSSPCRWVSCLRRTPVMQDSDPYPTTTSSYLGYICKDPTSKQVTVTGTKGFSISFLGGHNAILCDPQPRLQGSPQAGANTAPSRPPYWRNPGLDAASATLWFPKPPPPPPASLAGVETARNAPEPDL